MTSPDSMIERCARAIEDEIASNRTPRVGLPRWTYQSLTRAVLSVLREPSEGMIEAARAAQEEIGTMNAQGVEACIRGAIDFALAEKG